MEFRNTGQSEGDLKKKIQKLFDEAKKKWPGVFSDESRIDLSPSHLSICVSGLQDVKLFNSNLQVIDEAFEYLVSKSSKGEKGQYFTPRHVIDMCVKMLNPKKGEYMIDAVADEKHFALFNELMPLNIQARYPDDKELLLKALTAGKSKDILKRTKGFYAWIRKLLK